MTNYSITLKTTLSNLTTCDSTEDTLNAEVHSDRNPVSGVWITQCGHDDHTWPGTRHKQEERVVLGISSNGRLWEAMVLLRLRIPG